MKYIISGIICTLGFGFNVIMTILSILELKEEIDNDKIL